MKVTIVSVVEFARPIRVMPGDTISFKHKYRVGFSSVTEKLSKMPINDTAIWTHSILFKLDGQIHHIIGNTATIAWLKSESS